MAVPKLILRGLEEPTGIFAGFWAWLFNEKNRPDNVDIHRLDFEKPCDLILGQRPVQMEGT